MKKITKLWTLGATALATATPATVLAQTPFEDAGKLVSDVGEAAGVDTPSGQDGLTKIIGNIINVALGFLGIVLLAYLLYAGFLWMTAGGETEKVGKAKDMIKNAIIGLIIIVAAFAISSFVLSSLVKATSGV